MIVFISFSPEVAGSVVPASQVAVPEDGEPAEVVVSPSVEFAPRHSGGIPGLYVSD